MNLPLHAPTHLPRRWRSLALCLAGAVLALTPVARAQVTATLTTLHDFAPATDGASPSTLIQGPDGNLYGSALSGGSGGGGTVFQITPAGALTLVYSFVPGYDPATGLFIGSEPSPLALNSDGNFYGTTYQNTAFELSPAGTLTLLNTFPFDIISNIGTDPLGGLILATDGNFYGVCSSGGGSYYGTFFGTVFRLTPDGTLSHVHEFNAISIDGEMVPKAALIQARDGNLYGTTAGGGFYAGGFQSGTLLGSVFRVALDGTETALHLFQGTDGSTPVAALLQGSDGNLYGTASQGGANGFGTVFQCKLDGTLTTLHSFNKTDGSNPGSGLTEGPDGNFYGTTANGGSYNDGTVFQLTPGGVLTTLHSFNGDDGSQPMAKLFQASDGSFYGTTSTGGSQGGGTIFRLTLNIPGTLQFSVAAYSVDESAGTATITVNRTFGSTGAVTINYATADGTALAGTDYTATSGTLSWADGDATAKTFTVPILDRSLDDESTRSLSLTLSAAAGGAALGPLAVASLTIQENDPPAVSVVATVPQTEFGSDDAGEFTLSLDKAATADLKVAYKVKGSAVNGTDYEPLKGFVKIKAGKTSKVLKVVPLRGHTVKKVVRLVLQPGDGYMVATPTAVKVKILPSIQ